MIIVPPSASTWTPSMNPAPSAGLRLPECEHAVAPTGSTQYCTKFGAPATPLSSFQAMTASPVLATATEGGLLVRGEPAVTVLPAASALTQSARAAIAVSPLSRHARRNTAVRPNSRHIPHPLPSIPLT
jgi:hypothetical protein